MWRLRGVKRFTMSELASFKNPPVVEVVMGVQFTRLEKLTLAEVVQFWASIKDEFPGFESKPPLAPLIEDLSGYGISKEATISFGGTSLPRIFLVHISSQWVIQLQANRFHLNWRRADSSSVYPRYEAVRETFSTQWTRFQNFVSEKGLGDLQITQLEITYFNQIVGLSKSMSLGDVLPDFQWRQSPRKLSPPEFCEASCSFLASDKRSRLRATIVPGFSDSRDPIINFELTVRGEKGDKTVTDWFDQGRRWIVTAFEDMTSPRWHKIWERDNE